MWGKGITAHMRTRDMYEDSCAPRVVSNLIITAQRLLTVYSLQLVTGTSSRSSSSSSMCESIACAARCARFTPPEASALSDLRPALSKDQLLTDQGDRVDPHLELIWTQRQPCGEGAHTPCKQARSYRVEALAPRDSGKRAH